MLFLVAEHFSRHILEEIGRAGEIDEKPGTGIAVQIDIENAIVDYHGLVMNGLLEMYS